MSALCKFLALSPWRNSSRLCAALSYRQCLSVRTLQLSARTLNNHSPDYYAVLGLTKAATPEQVKLAYFKRAKKYHPDSNPTEEARWMFQLTAEAYEVLSDEKRRKSFDECGSGGYTYGGTAQGPVRPGDHQNFSAEELFDKIFGESGKGEDRDRVEFAEHASSHYGHEAGREYKVNVSFEDAARGVDVRQALSIKCVCPKCRGSKSELGYTWQVCVYCEGTGIETEKVGHVLTRKTCSYCEGTRQFNRFKCDECEGTGQTITIFDQMVRIPPGCENGQVLKVPIDQNIMRTTVAHDPFFYVYVTVEKSEDFTKEDYDLFSEADVSVAQALLGGTISVRGLHKERLEVRVPPLTDGTKSLTVPGEGIVRSDGLHKGCHFVKVGIRPPSALSDRQRWIWTELARLEEDLSSGGTVNGLETSDSHKYEVNAVEASVVWRKFNVKKKKAPDREESSAVRDKSSSSSSSGGFSFNLWSSH